MDFTSNLKISRKNAICRVNIFIFSVQLKILLKNVIEITTHCQPGTCELNNWFHWLSENINVKEKCTTERKTAFGLYLWEQKKCTGRDWPATAHGWRNAMWNAFVASAAKLWINRVVCVVSGPSAFKCKPHARTLSPTGWMPKCMVREKNEDEMRNCILWSLIEDTARAICRGSALLFAISLCVPPVSGHTQISASNVSWIIFFLIICFMSV